MRRSIKSNWLRRFLRSTTTAGRLKNKAEDRAFKCERCTSAMAWAWNNHVLRDNDAVRQAEVIRKMCPVGKLNVLAMHVADGGVPEWIAKRNEAAFREELRAEST